ncbi:MAG: ion transporter [Candidatus Woesearchaeota archaeon]
MDNIGFIYDRIYHPCRCSSQKKDYVFSFYGIIDFIAIAPAFLMLFFPQLQIALTLRLLRFFRIFRSLKLMIFLEQESYLWVGLKKSFPKIFIFIITVFIISIIIGSLMYVIEGHQPGFENIPLAIYWTIVTLTTVGYGDIVPITSIGKMLATFLILIGYGIIAVPTGLVTVDLYKAHHEHKQKNK